MHDEIKQAVGIEKANCETCCWLGFDGDGPEYNGTWLVCNRFERMGYLKSFPFQKEMKCWEPSFWQSKFAGHVYSGEQKEIMDLIQKFVVARDGLSGCRQMWE